MTFFRTSLSIVIVKVICASCLYAEVSGKPAGSHQAPSLRLSGSEHALAKKQVTLAKSHADALENRLGSMMKMPVADSNQAWKHVHELISELRNQSHKISEEMTALKKLNPGKAEWLALNQTVGNDLRVLQLKLESVRQKYKALLEGAAGISQNSKIDALKEDVKAKRGEIESKFKAGEQARNSDYNILLSIIKTINEELGVFNKAML